MKKTIICLFVLVGIFITCASAWAASARQISQFGITWTFDREYEYGRFANGDYWVVGPVRIVDIDPRSTTVGGRIVHGSMINPDPTSATNGYDSALSGTYVESLNAGRPNGRTISSSNPLVVQPRSSLISVESTIPPAPRYKLERASVLTILSAPAPEGGFRPAYTGNNKAIRFNKRQLDYSKLKQISGIGTFGIRLKQRAGDAQASSIERSIERVWLDHCPLLGGQLRQHHPVQNLDDYDRDMSKQFATGVVMMHLDYGNQPDFASYGSNRAYKETALIRLVQIGIDYYGMIENGVRNNWRQDHGRKLPILFAGLLLNNQAMLSVGERTGDYLYSDGHGLGDPPADMIFFEEDSITFHVTQEHIDMTHSSAWRPDSRYPAVPYGSGDLGLPEWGSTKSSGYRGITKSWGHAYRNVTGGSLSSIALAVLLSEIEKEWNHNALLDYADRYISVVGSCVNGNAGNGIPCLVYELHGAYRDDYGCMWVSNNPSDTYAQGHYECVGERLRCSWQQTNAGRLVTDASQYPNARARDYDPCRLSSGIPPIILYGDVSENGSISAYDASLAAQYAVGLINLDSDQITKADVTGNGAVSATDGSWISRKAVNPTIVFPVEQ